MERIQPGAFGDRAHRSKPAELEDRRKSQGEAQGGLDQDDLDAYAAKRKKGRARWCQCAHRRGGRILPPQDAGDARGVRGSHRHDSGAVGGPASGRTTRRAESARGARDDRSTDPTRKQNVEKLLGPTSSEQFAQFVAIGKLITDFAPVARRSGRTEKPSTMTSASPWSSRKRRMKRITISTKSSRRATWTMRMMTKGGEHTGGVGVKGVVLMALYGGG